MLLLFDDGEDANIEDIRVDRNVRRSGEVFCDIFLYKLCLFFCVNANSQSARIIKHAQMHVL